MYLKWAHVYRQLCVEEFDTLEEAVLTAEGASDAGTEYMECIEGPDGIVSDAEYREIVDKQREWQRATWAAAKPNTHEVLVMPPQVTDGDWVSAQSFESFDAAWDFAGVLAGVVGVSRVRIDKL